MIRSGDLRYRVTLQGKVSTKDDEGNLSASYPDIQDIWANMKPGGGEYVHRRYGIMDDSITMIMECRPNPAVTEMNVVKWDKQYEIVHVARYLDHYVGLLRPLWKAVT